ncbi:MAG TPA: hypothetical protein VMH84_17305 [Xanthobacteraceae bacterium]|nr:hypothetical protein [Xanthobacteraceae bacterium]
MNEKFEEGDRLFTEKILTDSQPAPWLALKRDHAANIKSVAGNPDEDAGTQP